MANAQIARLLEFATAQLATEAFLAQSGDAIPNVPPQSEVKDRLEGGNFHTSRFSATQASQFTGASNGYEVLRQYRNDPLLHEGTGFSGTLFKNRQTGELTLSFRSTEFIDDAVRDATATARLEIRDLGWAFGQIADMEKWYAQLRADPELLGGKRFYVTGYSLGGHLATVFSILRREAYDITGDLDANPVIATYTFNGAGTGGLVGGSLTELFAKFTRIQADYVASPEWNALSPGDKTTVRSVAQTRVDNIIAEQARIERLIDVQHAFGVKPPLGNQASLDYQIAAWLVGFESTPVSRFPLLGGVNDFPTKLHFVEPPRRIENLVEVFGADAGRIETEFLALSNPSFIAFSGLHHGKESIGAYIEDQPLFRGNYAVSGPLAGFQVVSNQSLNDFADSHSLVLLVDSLALMAAMERLDAGITIEQANRVFALATRSRGQTVLFDQGRAEGDTLETVLDALGRLLVGPGFQPTVSARSLLGNTWHESELREAFHRGLAAVNGAIDANGAALAGTFRIVVPSAHGAEEIARKAGAAGPVGSAWRYALAHLNPFVLEPTTAAVPAQYAEARYGLFDAASNPHGLSAEYVRDRAAFLAWKILDHAANGQIELRSNRAETYVYTDKALKDSSFNAVTFTVFGTRLDGQSSPVHVAFGGEGGDIILGGDVFAGDWLYGGGGVDRLAGNGGNDYLEGGADNDVLEGGNGDDRLVGGQGDDILEGGSGFDTYVVGSGADRVRDADGRGRLLDSKDVSLSGRYLKQGGLYLLESDHSITATRGTATGITIRMSSGASAEIENYASGALGIYLIDHPEEGEPVPPDVFPQTAGSDSFSYGFSNGAVSVQGLGGNDLVGVAVVPPGNPLPAQTGSVVEGGADSDAVFGGDGNDRLFGGVRADIDGLVSGTAPAFSTEREVVTGNRGNDLLVGGAGSDWLAGGRGEDEIYGGAGDDVIAGGGQIWAGSYWNGGGFLLNFANGLDAPDLAPGQVLPVFQDTLLFGVNLGTQSGLQFLLPGTVAAIEADGRIARSGFNDADHEDAADTIFAGAGNDEVWAGYGDDHVEGGADADTVRGEEGADTIFGGSEADLLYGDGEDTPPPHHGGDYLDGGAGDDVLIGHGGADTLFGGTETDVLYGDADTLAADFHGDDYLDGGAGEDALHGQSGHDRLYGGIGNDVLHGGPGDDYLEGEAGNDRLFGDAGSDAMHGGDGRDELRGGGDDDHLAGGDGNDTLFGEGGNDGLYGGAGVDVLEGGEGDDTLAGGTGVDHLMGGPGNDTYLVGRGDEHDTIVDSEGTNRIRFADGYGGAELRINQVVGTQGLRVFFGEAEGDSVTIADGLSYTVTEFEFANATVRSLRDVLNAAQTGPITQTGSGTGATILGGSGGDRLTAGEGDALDGGRGDDLLFLPASNAVVMLGGDGGADTIIGTPGALTFVFDESVDPASAFFTRVTPDDKRLTTARDLVLHYGNPGASIFIPDSPHVVNYGYTFASGAFFDHVGLLERSGLPLEWIGSGEAESVSGTSFGDSLAGGDGADTLQGRDGDDLLDGGDGNDGLGGGAGSDYLDGGAGSDTLAGGDGDDRYALVPGDGVDIVIDNAGADLIEFGGDVTLEDITAELVNGTDGNIYLAIGYGPGDTVLVRQNFDANASTGTIEFKVDGATIGSAELSSLKYASPLDFAGANEAIRLSGSRYDDTLIGSTRDDRLEGGDGDDRMAGDAGGDVLVGGAGNDLLVGNAGDDVLDGGAGADTYRMHRGMGKDLVLDRSGDLNTLALGTGIGAGDLQAQRAGDDLHLLFRNSREGVVIPGYFVPGEAETAQSWQVEFPDSTVAPLDALIGSLGPVAHPGDIAALVADFELRARVWYESALVAAGYSRLADGSFRHEARTDTASLSTRTVNSVRFEFPGQVENATAISRDTVPVELIDQSTSSSRSVRLVQDPVPGQGAFVGFYAGGNRPHSGSSGATRYFDLDSLSYSGIDYGTNYEAIASPNFYDDPLFGQQLQATAGYRVYPAGTVAGYVPREVEHTHVETAFHHRVNIASLTAGGADSAIDAAPFAIVDGGAGNDDIRTPEQATILIPAQLLPGHIGAPGVLLYGNDGDDTLAGSKFDDVLVGGAGSDELHGGAGNDTYVMFGGDGWDEIVERGPNPPGLARANVLRPPAAVGPGDLTFSWTEELRSAPLTEPGHGSDRFLPYADPVQSLHAVLHVSFGGGDGVRIVIPHAEHGAAAGIDFIEFGNGARLSMASVLASAPAQNLNPHHQANVLDVPTPDSGSSGFLAADFEIPGFELPFPVPPVASNAPVYGGPGDDTIRARTAIGGRGRDTLTGTDSADELIGALPISYSGNVVATLWEEGDVFRGGRGDDRIVTSAGSDSIEFDLGDGYDVVTDLQHEDFYYSYGGTLDSLLDTNFDPTARDPSHRAQLLAGRDTLRFGSDIAPDDIRVHRSASRDTASDPLGNFDSLVFAHVNGADAVGFRNWYMSMPGGTDAGAEPHEQLSRVEFHDGTVWDRGAIQALAANALRRMTASGTGGTLVGTELNDHLIGGDGADSLAGGRGNDVLDGGGGNDQYFFEPGDGTDLLVESGVGDFDVLRFGPGVTPGMLTLGLGSLVIRIGESGDAVHIGGFDPADALGSGTIESFVFSDDTVLAYGDLLERGFDLIGTPGDDVLTGTNLDDRFYGHAGDDSLAGGTGDDTYWFARGWGIDHAEDGEGGHDAVAFMPGIAPQDVIVTRQGTGIALSIAGTTDRLTFRQEHGTGWFVEEVRFADGTRWDAATVESLVQESAPNSAPVLATAMADRSVAAGAAFVFAMPAGTFFDADAGDTLLLSARRADGTPLPAWLAFDAGTRTFGGMPTDADTGVVGVRVTATDAGGLSASDVFEVTVTAAPSGGGTPGTEPGPEGPSPAPGTGGGGATGNSDAGDANDAAGGDGISAQRAASDPGFENATDGMPAPADGRANGVDRMFPADEVGNRMPFATSGAPSLVDTLDLLFGGSAHSPFELAARELERPVGREVALSAVEIARRWDLVARYGDSLAFEADEHAREAASLDWRLDDAVLGITGFGAGVGPAGIAGVGRGAANLQALNGLADGFQHLRG